MSCTAGQYIQVYLDHFTEFKTYMEKRGDCKAMSEKYKEIDEDFAGALFDAWSDMFTRSSF